MKASSKLIESLKKFESCRLTAYQDGVGVWTIGYGHTAGVKPGDRITLYQAEQFLHEDLAKFEAAASKVRNVSTHGRFELGKVFV
jgi:lysozyme